MKSRTQIRRLTMAAMMGAVAFVLMYFSFSVPFLSPFADFDFSYLPELIGGYILGPIGAVQIIAVKILLKLVFKGTSSMLTGELQKFLLSCAYVLPSVIYYRRHKTRRGAAIGLVIGTVVGVCTAILTNVYIIFPFYIKLYGMDWNAIVGMCSAVNPWIHSVPTMVAFSVIPFNLIAMSVTSLIAVLVYKKISVPLKKWIQ